jgi:hypothetical protein
MVEGAEVSSIFSDFICVSLYLMTTLPCQVINQMLANDQDGYFEEISISKSEWICASALIEVMEVSSIYLYLKHYVTY